MNNMTIKDIYPIQTMDIAKTEARFDNVDEIIQYIKEKVESHPVATYIATFDHYAHTSNLPEHIINPDISDAKIAVFCFGKELPMAQMAAIRPRGIGVVQEDDKYVITFMDAPNPQAQESMIAWAKGIKK